MRLFLTALFSLILIALPAWAEETQNRFEFDKSHTRILFFINHMGFSETVGDVTQYDGSFTFDETAPEKSTLNVTLRPDGIRTPSPELDKHLQSAEFFNSTQFPEITFVSKEVKITGKNTGDVTGDLTMLGVTKPVTLHVTFNKGDYHMMTGEYVAGFAAEATLKRSSFGMTYGLPFVGDEVRLVIHTEAVNKSRKKPVEKKS